MNKIGIVTIVSNNFGNRLQNYALQEILKEIGCSVETMRRAPKKQSMKDKIKSICQILLQTKGAKFQQFDKNINFADHVLSRDNFPVGLDNEYDYFIVGSDQVWNPNYDFVAGECDFLTFAAPSKRIAYAPSFGVNVIPKEKQAFFSERLNSFASLSVREEAGAKIIRELTGKDAPVVLDPTLMLSGDQWKRVMRPSKAIPKGKYALVYALGEQMDEFKEAIVYYGTQMQVFNIREIMNNGRELPIGPAEFLYAISNATVVLTDSYHCTVFALIFGKDVYTFERSGISMNSRIKTLHQLLGIEQKDYKKIRIDTQAVHDNILKLQAESMQYIRHALDKNTLNNYR